MTNCELSPSVAHLTRLPAKQLEDDLPYYDKGAVFILEEAAAEIRQQAKRIVSPRTFIRLALARAALIEGRVAELKRGQP